jgi:hypothetical protein
MPTPGPCQRLQDEVTNLEDEIQTLLDFIKEVPIEDQPAAMRAVARLQRQLGALNLQLTACLHDPTPYLLQLDGIEVTQAIQDLNNSVTLVGGKKTVVRAYLSYYGSSGITVRATLQAQRPGSGAVSVMSQAPVFLDPAKAADTVAKRQDAALSLNFVLPDSQVGPGPLTLTLGSVTNTATLTMLSVAFNSATTVHFENSHPLRVRVLAVRYSQQISPPAPASTFLATANDLQHLQSWLRRAYPVADVIWSTATIDANAAAPFTSGDINAQLAAIRAQDMAAGGDKRTHYYGIVSDGGFFMRGSAAGIPATADPSTVASGPTGPATWGWDFDGSYGDWYGGHELGHTFGRKHPGFCGESHDDPAYPYTAGQLASSDSSFVGFDLGDTSLGIPLTALPGTTWHDVMTYCNTQWLSDYTYSGIRSRLADEDALPAGPVPAAVPVPQMAAGGRPDERFPDAAGAHQAVLGRNLISVVASINLTSGQGKFEYVQPVPSGEASGLDPHSPIVVRALRADGHLLRDYPVAVKLNSELGPGDEHIGLVDTVVPIDPDARVLELIVHGRTADTFQATGAQPPSRKSAKLVAMEEGAVVLAWEPGAPPEPTHTYTVQVSTDGGLTWQTLAVGLTEPNVRIDRSQFAPGQTVQVRVIATDGFSRSEVTTEQFTA